MLVSALSSEAHEPFRYMRSEMSPQMMRNAGCAENAERNKKSRARGLTVIAASVHGLLPPTCSRND